MESKRPLFKKGQEPNGDSLSSVEISWHDFQTGAFGVWLPDRRSGQDRAAARPDYRELLFLTRQLMVQEAPDLCYQKVLAYLRDATGGPAEDYIPVSESDIANYRAFHPNVKAHGKTKQPL